MPSFDIVSHVNSMEIENAVNQAKKELANRFDFKASKWEIVLEKAEIKLTADNEFKVRTLNEIVVGRLAKRGRASRSNTASRARWPRRSPASSATNCKPSSPPCAPMNSP